MTEIEKFDLSFYNPVVVIMSEQRHSLISTEPVLLLEIKKRAYSPLIND